MSSSRVYDVVILGPDVGGAVAAALSARRGLRMCVDISHTKLAANHFGFNFADGLAQLGPHTAHLHFGDAKGLDGEGLQVGDQARDPVGET